MHVCNAHTCTPRLMYALQLTYPFTDNYFVHKGCKAIQSKGALYSEVMFQSESNRNNIFSCNNIFNLACCLKHFMIVLRRPSFFVKAYTC